MQKIGLQIRITVTELQEERIAKIAKRHGIPKAQVYRNMIEFGLDSYDVFDKVGIAKFAEFEERTKEMVKLWLNRRQRKLF